MRFTVRCERVDCGEYVAHCVSQQDADEVKQRHDNFTGHDSVIESYYSTPFEGLL